MHFRVVTSKDSVGPQTTRVLSKINENDYMHQILLNERAWHILQFKWRLTKSVSIDLQYAEVQNNAPLGFYKMGLLSQFRLFFQE